MREVEEDQEREWCEERRELKGGKNESPMIDGLSFTLIRATNDWQRMA